MLIIKMVVMLFKVYWIIGESKITQGSIPKVESGLLVIFYSMQNIIVII